MCGKMSKLLSEEVCTRKVQGYSARTTSVAATSSGNMLHHQDSNIKARVSKHPCSIVDESLNSTILDRSPTSITAN